MANPHLQRARGLVHHASHVVVLTGAGISAESGVPTFRGDGGLWKNYRAEDLATPEAFERNPDLVWEWYDWRRAKIVDAKPNAGHEALVALEEAKPKFHLVTQNIDGLHRMAGSKNVIEIHGCIWILRCTGCGKEREDQTAPLPECPPKCECGAMLRPGVVWFGEALPQDGLQTAFRMAQVCDLLLVVGTSAVVYPAANVAQIAIQMGTSVIEVNPEQTPLTQYVTVALRGKSGEILPKLL